MNFMEHFKPELEIPKSISCTLAEKSITELEKEGWEYDYYFHSNISKQWDYACYKVKQMNAEGFWDPILVPGQTETERNNGIAYIYKKKINQKKDQSIKINQYKQ